MKKILIAYVTKTGTTQETAEVLNQIFLARDLLVEVKPLSTVTNLDGFSGVVIGAPINGMSWLPEAVEFVRNFKSVLQSIPTAYYLHSYMLDNCRPFWQNQIDKSFHPAEAILKPIMEGMFGGRIATELPLFARLIFGVRKNTPLDRRNPAEIQAWAEKLADVFLHKSGNASDRMAH